MSETQPMNHEESKAYFLAYLQTLGDSGFDAVIELAQAEKRKRAIAYLQDVAKDATISDDEVQKIVGSERQSWDLPLADYAKVQLEIIAFREKLRKEGFSQFMPFVHAIGWTKKLRRLMGDGVCAFMKGDDPKEA